MNSDLCKRDIDGTDEYVPGESEKAKGYPASGRVIGPITHQEMKNQKETVTAASATGDYNSHNTGASQRSDRDGGFEWPVAAGGYLRPD